MPFDMEKLNEGEWFRYFGSSIGENGEITYFEPEPDAERVCLRPIGSEELNKIHSQTRKKQKEFVLNPKTRQMERVSYEDQTSEQERVEFGMFWDYMITNWELKDEKGESIPCTKENKIKLMSHPPFARFITRCLQILNSSKKQQEEDKEKN